MGAPTGDNDDVISAINITPLVDVMLVLLIIFMIAAPMVYQKSLPVALPSASTAEETKQSPVTFTISKDGSLSVDSKPVTWADVPSQLALLSGDQPVIIQADEESMHRELVRLLDEVRKSGKTKIAISVKKSP
jgi:biopolymer transport protein ExbD